MSRTHLLIPDTQVKPGVDTQHLTWIGKYIVDKQPDVIVHIGDHWDMPSLSKWDSKKKMEGKRYKQDIAAGNEGMERLLAPLHAYNAQRRATKHKQYIPEMHFTKGNHEHRVTRAMEESPEYEGLVSEDDFRLGEWQVHEFLQPVVIDGVHYAHYFYNPMSGRPFGGMMATRLKNVGHTFTMGHQQTLDYAIRFVGNTSQHGLVAGACYLHDEEYKGPQGNHHWRGVVMKHDVRDGQYDPMFVSLDYLRRRYGRGAGRQTG